MFKLTDISRHYLLGGELVHALKNVSLDIQQGEFVAIIGASGSGKSTLMNILGCLDRADKGHVEILGQDVVELTDIELAMLRSTRVGFIFQNYHLLPGLSAMENVTLAGLYAGYSKDVAQKRAQKLLEEVGLGGRLTHLPSQLSGGQQQRVAVARALFHNNAAILADEPTGALDSQSTQDLLNIFRTLNEQGRTIVLITHDPAVAAIANRIITIEDGCISGDRVTENSLSKVESFTNESTIISVNSDRRSDSLMIYESITATLHLMRRHLTRTILTLFGIMIGIAAVIFIVALGDGARKAVVDTIASLGRNLIVVMTDDSEHEPNAPAIQHFTMEERDEIASIPGVSVAVLEMPVSRTVKAGSRTTSTLVTGTEANFPQVHDWPVWRGGFFSEQDERSISAVAVLGRKVAEKLFPQDDALGKTITIESSLFDVIGIMSSKGASPAGIDLDDIVLISFSSAILRLGQERRAEYIMVKTAHWAEPQTVSMQIENRLDSLRNGHEAAARTLNNIVAMELKTKDTLTTLLAALSLISLIVGAVGITNITLIGVVERTREIGLRKAIGARRSDIALQFLIETGVLAAIGGLGGIALGLLCIAGAAMVGFPVVFNPAALLASLIVATLTGVAAGVVPARRAAALNPVTALANL
ncbi:MAG: ABC transporter permease [Pseudomonadales bacterium]|nr:ABC transporter permease [Pseudomonadales bacterium]